MVCLGQGRLPHRHVVRPGQPEGPVGKRGQHQMEKTMNEQRAVKDLAVGAVIHLDGFEEPLTVRAAKKIKKGLDAGKLEVTLGTPDGETERVALGPEEKVMVVEAQPGVDEKRAASGKKPAKANKGKGKGKKKAQSQAKAEPADAAQPEQVQTPTAQTDTEPAKKSRGRKQPAADKKLSALDAAFKVLSETGASMSCQELVQVMADKGYWTSPGGKTPAATLYSAILRELQTKGDQARFRKTERGKFAAVVAQ
jgi:HB1, ASXL, restriction endonuclease HTH domain